MYSRPTEYLCGQPTGHSKCANTGNSGRWTAGSADVGLIMHRPSARVHCSPLIHRPISSKNSRKTRNPAKDYLIFPRNEDGGVVVATYSREKIFARIFNKRSLNCKSAIEPVSLGERYARNLNLKLVPCV